MIKLIKNWIDRKISDYHYFLAVRVTAEVVSELTSRIICDIGINELEQIVIQARKNQAGSPGHCDYTNLAKLYGEIIQKRRSRRLIL